MSTLLAHDERPDAPTRDQIIAAAAMLRDFPQVDLGTRHQLAGGMYARTIFIPAGTILAGAAHKTEHFDVMQGDVSIVTPNGLMRISGTHTLITPAGTERQGFAHSDTVWTTICRTDKLAIEEIEAELVHTPELLQTRNPAIGLAPVERLEH